MRPFCDFQTLCEKSTKSKMREFELHILFIECVSERKWALICKVTLRYVLFHANQMEARKL